MKKIWLGIGLMLTLGLGLFLWFTQNSVKDTTRKMPIEVSEYLKANYSSEIATFGAIGSEGHWSRDLKGNALTLDEVRDNYGEDWAEKFHNFLRDFITYSNDFVDVNHKLHQADYYNTLAGMYQSKNFPLSYIVRNKEQSGGRERFTMVSESSTGLVCREGFDFYIPGDIDEGEDYFTENTFIDHVTYYGVTCDNEVKFEELLNV